MGLGPPVTCPEEGISILRRVSNQVGQYQTWRTSELFSEGLVLLVLAEYPQTHSALARWLRWRLIDYIRSVEGRYERPTVVPTDGLDVDTADPNDDIEKLLSEMTIDAIADETAYIHRSAPDVVRAYADSTPMKRVADRWGLSESRLSQVARLVREHLIQLELDTRRRKRPSTECEGHS